MHPPSNNDVKKLRIRPTENYGEAKAYEGDSLGRSKFGGDLKVLLAKSTPPFVLAIDSRWGTGKTWFLHHFNTDLRESGFRTVTFNAWKNDLSDTPLVALICEIEQQLDEGKKSKKIEKLKAAGKALMKIALPIAVKASTAGLVDVSNILNNESEKVISSELGKLSDQIVRRAFNDYEASNTTLDRFRSALESITCSQESGDLPVIFLIDELDRCRPDYAVRFLEIAKHFFDADGIIFVIATDYGQLAATVSSLYGPNFDSSGYLRRFFDLKYRFPDPSIAEFVETELRILNLRYPHDLSSIEIFPFVGLFSQLKMDLRSQQRCLTRFAVGSLNVKFEAIGKGTVTFFQTLIVIQEWNSVFFGRLINGEVAPEELDEKFLVFPGSPFLDMHNRPGILARSLVLIIGDCVSDKFQKTIGRFATNNDPHSLEANISTTISQLRNMLFEGQEREFFDRARKLLDFAYRFQ